MLTVYITIVLCFNVFNIIFAQIELSTTTIWQTNATTIAGSSSSRLNALHGIHIDETDTLYIADSGNNRIVIMKMNATNISLVLGTGQGSGLTQFYQPRDVFVTQTAIYVLDSRNYRIQQYAKNGTFLATVAGITQSPGNLNTMDKIGDAYSLHVDNDAYIYVSDSENHRVLRFPPNSTNGTMGVLVAGTGIAGSGRNQLYGPRGIFVDGDRNLYIADTYNHRIQKWASGACYGITVAGTGSAGTSLHHLYSPTAVVVDANDYLYIVDQNNHRIVRWPYFNCTADCIAGDPLGYQGQTSDRLSYPTDLSFDQNGSLFVADSLNNRVQKIERIDSPQLTEQSTMFISMTTSMPFETVSDVGLDLPPLAEWMTNATTVAEPKNVVIDSVYGIAIDHNDTMYIADSNNHRILIMRVNASNVSIILGGRLGSAINEFYWPTKLYVDDTDIYVLDTYNYRVQRYAKNGTFLVTAAGITNGRGNQNTLDRFGVAYGLFVDDQGYLYVSDSENHRVLRFPPNSTNGTMGVLVAGTGIAGSGRNQLYGPRGIFVDGDRNLYIADTYNHRIQKWASGACYGITVAGTGSAGTSLDQLYTPITVIVDRNGYLYIVDQNNHRIIRLGSDECIGECIAACTSIYAGSSADRFNTPRDLAFDSDGSLYVVDEGNRRIQKFSPKNISKIIKTSTNTNRPRIQFNCMTKANVNSDGSSIYGSQYYLNSSCSECICSMLRMNMATTVLCREDVLGCRIIYSHPSLLMPYVKIDLNSRICYRAVN